MTLIARKEGKTYSEKEAIKKFNFMNKKQIKFVEIPNLKSSLSSYISIKNRRFTNKTIEKLVIKNDIIIIRLPSDSGYTAIRYCNKHSKQFFIEIVGCPWDSLWNYNLKGKILAPFNYYKLKSIALNSQYVLYVTNKFLQERYPSKGNNIGCSDVKLNSLDNNVLTKRLNKIELMEDMNTLILGTIAAVDVKYKGQSYVIRAIAKLKKEGINIKYILAGGGDNTYLKSVAKDNGVLEEINFIGSLPHEQVFKLLDSIDIYIQPSKLEGLSRSLVEAMSRGCPSIGANAGGTPELLNNDFIFRKGNVSDICEILKKLNTSLLIREAKRNFNKAKEFDVNLLDLKRNDFYLKFIESLK